MERDSFESLLHDAPLLQQQEQRRGDLFIPASHISLLEKLEHLSRFSHFVQVIVGTQGSGKTALVNQLLPAESEPGVRCCLIRSRAALSASDLLVQLCAGLDEELPGATDAERFRALLKCAERMAAAGMLWLVVVDDAEQLSASALLLLFKLQEHIRNPDAQPHLVLFGSEQLQEQLQKEPFRTLMTDRGHVMTLEPMTREELQGFVGHRLGHDVAELELKKLYSDSGGLPGRVIDLLEGQMRSDARPAIVKSSDTKPANKRPANKQLPDSQSLDAQSVDKQPEHGGGKKSWWLAVVVLLPFVAGGGWWFLNMDRPPASERVTLELPRPALDAQSGAPPTGPALIEETLEQRLERVRAALEQEQVALEQADELLPAVSVAVASSASTTANTSEAPASVALLPVAPVASSAEAAVKQPSAPKTRVLELPEHQSVTRVASGRRVNAEEGGATGGFGRSSELLEWDSKEYTLQMLGARKRDSVEQFIASQAQSERFYYFSTIYKSKPWYVVVYGRYPDRAAALAAVADLPLELRRIRPWARSVEGVQNDIRRKE